MSSPFTFPSGFLSPFPGTSNLLFPPSPLIPISTSPLAGLLASSQAQTPAGFPGFLNIRSTAAGTPGTLLSVPPGVGGSSRAGGSGVAGAPSEVGLEGVLLGIEEVLVLLGRAEMILQAMKGEYGAVFRAKEGDGGEDSGMTGGEGPGNGSRGTLGGIMALQQEYAQILLSLQPLLSTNLIGALPIPLSSAIPGSDPSNTTTSSAIPSENTAPIPSMSDLTIWAEKRAGLEFSRREGVRAGAKAVLDVFKTGRT